MRKCSTCQALAAEPTRKVGSALLGVFGRPAGTVDGNLYSDTLSGSSKIWGHDTIDALFDQRPDRYIPGSKRPMQVISQPGDRADLIEILQHATIGE